MDFRRLTSELSELIMKDPSNYIQPEDAMREELVGIRLYDKPIFKCGRAGDPLFDKLKDDAVLSRGFLFPDEWLPGAKSVISFFLPVSEQVRRANAEDISWPADEWLHSRIEGEITRDTLTKHLCGRLIAEGYGAVAPSLDERLVEDVPNFKTNWSERHTAFICGLGTFGMSRGLITERGVAGRLGSVITTLEIPPDSRDYSGIYDYCIECGVCAKNCPGEAIDASVPVGSAKSHLKCIKFLGTTRTNPPRGQSQKMRYGCGKCQVAVPCETRRP